MIADGIHLPPPGLADCLSSALVTSLPGGPYILPAALHPVLLVILQVALWSGGARASGRFPGWSCAAEREVSAKRGPSRGLGSLRCRSSRWR